MTITWVFLNSVVISLFYIVFYDMYIIQKVYTNYSKDPKLINIHIYKKNSGNLPYLSCSIILSKMSIYENIITSIDKYMKWSSESTNINDYELVINILVSGITHLEIFTSFLFTRLEILSSSQRSSYGGKLFENQLNPFRANSKRFFRADSNLVE